MKFGILHVLFGAIQWWKQAFHFRGFYIYMYNLHLRQPLSEEEFTFRKISISNKNR